VTLKSNPAARIVPERETQFGFDSTENITGPAPGPPPETTLNHGAPGNTDADQGQPLDVLTPKLPEPPVAGAFVFECDNE
jgi:hypothetical protein